MAIAMILAGCTTDGESDGVGASTTLTVAGQSVQFMQLRNADWERDQAIRPLAQPPAVAAVEPSLDWWEQYHRDRAIPGAIERQDLRISGHHVALDAQVTELKTFDTQPGQVGDRRAVLATSPEGEPVVVSIEMRDDYTVMLLSYALSLEELTALAETLEPVSEDEWLASGGQIVECAPAADCPAAPTD
jgi:hypothetical protein